MQQVKLHNTMCTCSDKNTEIWVSRTDEASHLLNVDSDKFCNNNINVMPDLIVYARKIAALFSVNNHVAK